MPSPRRFLGSILWVGATTGQTRSSPLLCLETVLFPGPRSRVHDPGRPCPRFWLRGGVATGLILTGICAGGRPARLSSAGIPAPAIEDPPRADEAEGKPHHALLAELPRMFGDRPWIPAPPPEPAVPL